MASAPAQDDANIARHAARIVDDLVADVIATRLELALPKLIDLFRNAGQGALPALLALVDGAAVVGANLVRKAEHLYRHQPALDRSVHHRRGLLDDLVIGQQRGG